jgi:transposase-like protein
VLTELKNRGGADLFIACVDGLKGFPAAISDHWERLTTCFASPPEMRRVIYTTNTIEAGNRSLRKVLKTPGALPSHEALIKLLFLALRNISQKWPMPVQHWKEPLNQFAILFEDRLPL